MQNGDGLQKGEWPDAGRTMLFQTRIAKPSTFDYLANIGLGNVLFNMPMEDARKAYGLPSETYSKDVEKGTSKDYFNESTVIFSYDKEGKLEAVELCAPITLSINGIEILGQPLMKTIRALEKIALFNITQEQDHDFRTLGILIPKKNTIDYVIVYRNGLLE